MEDYTTVVSDDDHQIFIKTEVEDPGDYNYDSDTLESSMRDININYLVDVQFESEIKQEYQHEEFAFVDVCKLEMKEEISDEVKTTTSSDIIETGKNNSAVNKPVKGTQRNEKLHYCDTCDYVTKLKNDLKNHQIKLHKEMKPFKYDQCDYQTKTEYGLQQHRYVHTDERPFKCDECDYTAKKQYDLKRHYQRKHTEVETFQCDECDYTTKYQSDLTRHKKLHLDKDKVKKTYKCDSCDYVTIQQNNLKKHQLMHKTNDEVKLFSCTKCEFVTKYKKSLTNHEITHLAATIPCDQCDYMAKTLDYLKRHQLVHKDFSEVETFKCNLCDYISKRKRDLRDHVLKHNLKRCEI